MNFTDDLKLFINGNKKNILIYSESATGVIKSIQSICADKNIKTYTIHACDCNAINNEQLSKFNMTTENFDIAKLNFKNPDALYIIEEAQHLHIDLEKLFKGAYPVIIITSDRRFLAEFKECQDNILIDEGLDFYYYMDLPNLKIMEQLQLYIITDRKKEYIDLYQRTQNPVYRFMNINKFRDYDETVILSKAGAMYDKPIKDIYTLNSR